LVSESTVLLQRISIPQAAPKTQLPRTTRADVAQEERKVGP
jgi:hypothetical protein